jgi:hypothetical protein
MLLPDDLSDVLIQPFCPQISLLDFHRAMKRSKREEWPLKNNAIGFYP